MRRTIFLSSILSILTVAIVLLNTYAKPNQVRTIQKALPKVVMVYTNFSMPNSKTETKVDWIKQDDGSVVVRGTGVFITKYGHILTAAHVLTVSSQCLGINIELYGGDIYPAEIIHISERYDLAIIKIAATTTTPYVSLSYLPIPKIGQEVISIGNPLGLTFTVTHGIISALHRDLPNGYNFVQSDSFMNPGNSGGPLLNLWGELVGINSRIIPPVNAPIFTGLGFAVGVDQIREYLTVFKGLGE